MRWLLFLSRLAFLCGLFFLLSISLLIRDWVQDDAIVSTMIILGTVMGAVTVPLVNICYLIVLFWKRDIKTYVPLWLVTANFFFLLIFAFYIYYQNGQHNYQP